jgi:hypothetical protein
MHQRRSSKAAACLLLAETHSQPTVRFHPAPRECGALAMRRLIGEDRGEDRGGAGAELEWAILPSAVLADFGSPLSPSSEGSAARKRCGACELLAAPHACVHNTHTHFPTASLEPPRHHPPTPRGSRTLSAPTFTLQPPPAPELVQDFNIFGYARSKMDDEEFRDLIALTLTCRLDDSAAAECGAKMDYFLDRCHYCAGNYDVAEDFARLDGEMTTREVRATPSPPARPPPARMTDTLGIVPSPVPSPARHMRRLR